MSTRVWASRRKSVHASYPRAIAVFWVVVACTPLMAQMPAATQPGPYVVDIRGATSALPLDAVFFPSAPTGTSLPSRGFGVEAGAHVYPLPLGPARLGVGVSVLRVRGKSSSTVTSTPDVDAALTVIAPQLSLNFGTGAGWSYLSAGAGRARVTSVASAFTLPGAEPTSTPAEKANSGMVQSLNIGGGARWFSKDRLGVGFDVRFHLIAPGSADQARPATPRTTVVAASVGISVR